MSVVPTPFQEEMRFSVVIAAYDQREYVIETVRSVLGQTFPPHEVIVVADGCSDGTAEALRERFSRNPKVRVHEQANAGKCVARNTGIALATGNWVCFLDHDDLWHRRKLEVTADYLQRNPECKAVNHPLWFFADEESGPKSCFGFRRDFVARSLEECHQNVEGKPVTAPRDSYLQIRGRSFEMLLERNRGALSASVVRKDVLLRAGCFSPMQANGEDWTLFLGVARVTEWHTIPERLAFIRLHEAQGTHQSGGAIMILAGMLNVWYTGRPFREKLAAPKIFEELKRFGRPYRATVQTFLWSVLRRGDFRSARTVLRLGKLLLPRLTDFLYALVPPAVTWRWERYVLGMHR